MCETSISMWFVCKSCGNYFRKVEEFVAHKKEKHSREFQQTNCIVFEEMSDHNVDSLFPLVTMKEEFGVDSNDDEQSTETTVDSVDDATSSSKSVTCTNQDQSENNIFHKKIKLEDCNSDTDGSLNITEFECASYVNPGSSNQLLIDSDHDHQMTGFPDLESSNSNEFEYKVETTNESPTLFADEPPIYENDPLALPSKDSLLLFQFQCKLCCKKLTSDQELKIHVGICALNHVDRDRFCMTCNQKFCNAQSLHRHNVTRHEHVLGSGPRSNLVKCPLPNCQKMFPFNSQFKRHIKTHSDSRPYSCPYPDCDKTFKNRSDFTVHARIHTGERPYICTVENCTADFRRSSEFHRHLRRCTVKHNKLMQTTSEILKFE